MIQVRAFRGERKYVAECLDLPVVTQGDNFDELSSNIMEAIELHLEGENLSESGFEARSVVFIRFEPEAVM